MRSRSDHGRRPLRGENHDPAYPPSRPQKRSRILKTHKRSDATASHVKELSLADLVKQESAPPLADLRRAIDAKSSDGFAKAFGQLTEACNRCHRSAGVGFVVIRIPTASPFSNQLFPPTQAR
jgi:hypothetical protein